MLALAPDATIGGNARLHSLCLISLSMNIETSSSFLNFPIFFIKTENISSPISAAVFIFAISSDFFTIHWFSSNLLTSTSLRLNLFLNVRYVFTGTISLFIPRVFILSFFNNLLISSNGSFWNFFIIFVFEVLQTSSYSNSEQNNTGFLFFLKYKKVYTLSTFVN